MYTIPYGARALSVNVTVVSPASTGWLILYPYNTTIPFTSNINYRTNKTRANNAIIPVATPYSGFLVFNSGPSSVNYIVDVNGYFY